LEVFSLLSFATMQMVNQEDMVMFNSTQLKQHKNVFKEHKTLKSEKKSLTFKSFKKKLIVKMQEKISISKIYQIQLTILIKLKKKSKTN